MGEAIESHIKAFYFTMQLKKKTEELAEHRWNETNKWEYWGLNDKVEIREGEIEGEVLL